MSRPDQQRPDPDPPATTAAITEARTVEELLRRLRNRYRFLEDYFLLQAEAAFAERDTEMSADGLYALNEICREGGDLVDELIAQLPGDVVNARVSSARASRPGGGSGRSTRGREAEVSDDQGV